MTTLASASAPAKIILLGEHAVVYGHPAIAVPVDSLRATAYVSAGAGDKLRIVASSADQSAPDKLEADLLDEALTALADLLMDRLPGSLSGFTVQIESPIPIASGLGSGAAVAAAITRALGEALGQPLDNAALNDLVYEAEKIHHGNPSGIDNTVVVYEQPVYFVRNRPIEQIQISQPFEIIIADTGQRALTRVAVGAVRKLYDEQPGRIQPLLEKIGTMVAMARGAIERGDLKKLGQLMTHDHEFLRELTISSPELDRLVDAAVSAGALGAKLSGGGRGGNMIALVTPDTRSAVRDALETAGATQIFATTVGIES